MRKIALLLMSLSLWSCLAGIPNFDYIRDLDLSPGDEIRGITVHDNGNLIVVRQPINTTDLFVDEYLDVTGDSLLSNTVAAPQASLSGLALSTIDGMGVDFLSGSFYLSTVRPDVINFGGAMSSPSVMTLGAASSNDTLVCGGDNARYACIDREGQLSIFSTPLFDQQLPVYTYITDPTETLTSTTVRLEEPVKGVEIYNNFVFVYRGSITANTKQSFWIDVYDATTGEMVEQKEFDTRSLKGLPADVIQTVVPSGMTISQTTLYFGVTFESEDKQQIKSMLLGDVDLIPGLPDTGEVLDEHPVADAGQDFDANEEQTIQLDGSGSFDDHGIVRYQWTQISGRAVTLNNASSMIPSFSVSLTSGPESLAFRLTVYDVFNQSASDTVYVSVNNVDVADINHDGIDDYVLNGNAVQWGNSDGSTTASLPLPPGYVVGDSSGGGTITQVIGASAGELDVSPSGAATYSIPVKVAPGTNGLQPGVSLNYNSSGENGLMGMGWSVSAGEGVIARCPTNWAEDGYVDGVDFDANDQFCYNGQRLVAVEATHVGTGILKEYRTQTESWQRITAYGEDVLNPDHWIVEDKSGETYYFGQNTSSKQQESGGKNYAWYLNKVSDAANNYMEYVYIRNDASGEHYLSQVNYTQNDNLNNRHYNSVVFDYESRDDVKKGYSFGRAVNTLQRLKRVVAKTGEDVVYTYNVTYDYSPSTERSRVVAIQECAADNHCFAPTQFNWKSGAKGYTGISNQVSIPMDPFLGSGFSADINGDGVQESIFFQLIPNEPGVIRVVESIPSINGEGPSLESTSYIPQGISDGFSMANAAILNTDNDDADEILAGGYIIDFRDGNFWFTKLDSLPISGIPRYMTVDLNGDGRRDILVDSKDLCFITTCLDYNFYIYEQLPDGGFFNAPRKISHISKNKNSYSIQDIDGDGLGDLIETENSSDSTKKHWYAYINLGGAGGFTFSVNRITLTNLSNNVQCKGSFTDLNADGYPDFIFNNNGIWVVRFNRGGDGFSGETSTGFPANACEEFEGDVNGTHSVAHDYVVPVPFDYDTDGSVDLLLPPRVSYDAMNLNYSTSTVLDHSWQAISYRNGSFQIVDTGYPAYTNYIASYIDIGFGLQKISTLSNSYSFSLDVDGDANLDLFNVIYRQDSSATVSVSYYQDKYTDYMNKVTNGQGVSTEVVYKHQHKDDIYTSGSDQPFPLQSISNGMCLVSEIKQDDGLGGVLTTQYKYHNLQVHTQGLGSLGFEKVETINVDTGARSVATYSHDYVNHTQGMLLKQESYSPLGTDLGYSEPQYRIKFREGSDNKIRFLYPESNTSESRLTNGGLATGTLEKVAVDELEFDNGGCGLDCYSASAYGNVTRQVNTTVDHLDGLKQYTTTTVSQYVVENPTSWYLGKLTSAQVTRTGTGRQSATRNSLWTYDRFGGVATETIEPGSVNEMTTRYVRNDVGLVESTTVSGYNTASRTSTVGFDPLYRFIVRTTNPFGHTQHIQYNEVTGAKVKTTSANGLSSYSLQDGFGRPLAQYNADGTYVFTNLSETCTHSQCLYSLEVSPLAGANSRSEFDRLGRTVRQATETLDGRWAQVDIAYDNRGREISKTEPYFVGAISTDIYTSETLLFDELDRPMEVRDPDGHVSRADYQPSYTVTTNPLGQTHTVHTNALGEETRSVNHHNWAVTYTYDVFGKLLTTTDGDGVVTTLEYDDQGRKTALYDPDKGNWHYDYNALGQLVLQIDANGSRTCQAYDLLGRMVTRIDNYQGTVANAKNHCNGDATNSRTTTWEYDTLALGQLHAIHGENGYRETVRYDELIRPAQSERTIAGSVYTIKTAYDDYGRVDVTTYPSGFQVQNAYDTRGFLSAINNYHSGKAYWQPLSSNARGQVTQERLGNGVEQTNIFDDADGILRERSVDLLSANIMRREYVFDDIGNLTQRWDHKQGIHEQLGYDELNRLTTATAYLNGETVTQSVTYTANGNINSKSDVGAYTNGGIATGCVNTAGPHAVTQTTGVLNSSYCYDRNGNMISGNGKTVNYTAFDKPASIHRGTTTVQFEYGPGRELLRRTDTQNGKTSTKTMVGGLYEKVVDGTKTVEKHYIGGMVVRSVENGNTLAAKEHYLHKDHLGSAVAITDNLGNLTEQHAYDPWGKRRAPEWKTLLQTDVFNYATLYSSAVTQKGFTGHEMVDPVGLIHMGGRIYDPVLGRFLSADPVVQNHINGQNLNRYSYVLNNPLSMTDPSGFIHKKLKKAWKSARGKIRRGLKRAWSNTIGALGRELKRAFTKYEWLGSLVQIGVCATGNIVGCAAFSGAFTYGMTGDLGAGLTAFATTFATAQLWGGVGRILKDTTIQTQVLVHGITGGALSKAQGGSFKDGFISAAFSKAFAGGIDKLKVGADKWSYGSMAARTAVSAFIGGTTAKLTGGNFSNGARTAAFARMFNDHKDMNAIDKAKIANTTAEAVALTSQASKNPVVRGVSKVFGSFFGTISIGLDVAEYQNGEDSGIKTAVDIGVAAAPFVKGHPAVTGASIIYSVGADPVIESANAAASKAIKFNNSITEKDVMRGLGLFDFD